MMKNIALGVAITIAILLSIMLISANKNGVNTESIVRENVIGITGICKDDMWTTAKKRRGACAFHGGIKRWYEK